MQEIVKKLVDAHRKLAEAEEYDLTDNELSDEMIKEGSVRYPLSDADVETLEGLCGFPLSPLLREVFQTPGAMPRFGADVFGVEAWVCDFALKSNREVVDARKTYGWKLPPLVRIDAGEDFFAVTSDNEVIRVIWNEGNIDSRHGAFAKWLARYIDSALKKAEDPAAYREDDSAHEDPEAQFE